MTDGSVRRDVDADERGWRELVERHIPADHDCTQRAGDLAACRLAFDSDTESRSRGSRRRRWAVRGLVLLAIPLIVYSEITTPTGEMNYSGLGIGIVLMLAGGLSYL